MKDFKQLTVWQKAHQLVLAIYQESRQFPEAERFGLTGQMQRAAVSVPANIAEGCGRNSDAELKRFLTISMGSASELQYHCLLAHDLGFWSQTTHTALEVQIVEVKKMLATFIMKLEQVAVSFQPSAISKTRL